MTLHLHQSLIILLASLLHWTGAAPAADPEPQQGEDDRDHDEDDRDHDEDDDMLVSRVRLQEQDVSLHLLPATGLLLLQPSRLPRHLLQLPPVSAILLLLQQLPGLPELSF